MLAKRNSLQNVACTVDLAVYATWNLDKPGFCNSFFIKFMSKTISKLVRRRNPKMVVKVYTKQDVWARQFNTNVPSTPVRGCI